jgi:hypothetical protein
VGPTGAGGTTYPVTDPARLAEVLSTLGIDPPDLQVVGRLLVFRAGRHDLVPLWRRLRAEHARSGAWPLILGANYDFEELNQTYGRDPDQEVRRGLALDAAGRLAELRGAAMLVPDEDGPDETGETGDDTNAPPRGDATGLVPQEEDFYAARKAGWMGLISAEAGHRVPGLLCWPGGCNYDVEPADHVAVLKRWHERYGAELVVLGPDTLELWVPRPPTDPDEALAVADEQYSYCLDVVEQGVGTLDALAAVQVPSRRWFFWWD